MYMIRKWTVAGSPALENKIEAMIQGLRNRLQASFSPDEYSAVIIAGGYGRGEGGVQWVHGQETLHNNLDLVWVAPHASQVDAIRSKLESESKAFEDSYGVALDSFVIDEARLKRLPCLVMLYDMKFGHRLLLGKPETWAKMIRYTVADILPSDMRNLLVNRGSLLLINRWLLAQGQPSAGLREQIIRHGMKSDYRAGGCPFIHARGIPLELSRKTAPYERSFGSAHEIAPGLSQGGRVQIPAQLWSL
jgi:hypothetical protein